MLSLQKLYDTSYAHLSFIIFILVTLLCIPISPVIETMELRPYYSAKPFFTESWRLFSAHLVHASWSHLLINLLNVILLRAVFKEWLTNKDFVLFLIFSASFISLGLWLTTDYTSYVGFSGIFHGLLIYLLLKYWHNSRIIFSIAIICLIGKVFYEQLYGASTALAEFIEVGIAIESHSLGVASGLLFYFIQHITGRVAEGLAAKLIKK